jgi:hypothetical protein
VHSMTKLCFFIFALVHFRRRQLTFERFYFHPFILSLHNLMTFQFLDKQYFINFLRNNDRFYGVTLYVNVIFLITFFMKTKVPV